MSFGYHYLVFINENVFEGFIVKLFKRDFFITLDLRLLMIQLDVEIITSTKDDNDEIVYFVHEAVYWKVLNIEIHLSRNNFVQNSIFLPGVHKMIIHHIYRPKYVNKDIIIVKEQSVYHR